MQKSNRRRFLLAVGGSIGTAGALAMCGSERTWTDNKRTVARSRPALGTEVRITAIHRSSDIAEQAIDAAFEELSLVERLMSIYRSDSQISRLNTTGLYVSPHPHLVEVLRHAQHMSALSHGAFDVTVQLLWEIFAAAAKTQQLPNESAVAAARARVDWRQLTVNENRIQLEQPGMKITLNGIAQGFAADRVVATLRAAGIEHALIDAGELQPLGRSSRGKPWRVGIQHPRQPDAYIALADLKGRALATSGDYATPFSRDHRHHHILDPRTGHSPAELASVSIVAPTAMAADALSTASFVLGPERSLEMIANLPDVDAYFVLKDGETLATPGFPLSEQEAA
jgi:thiamine biosynthesis lipoprotein